jgi:hypothetical protein
MCGIQPLIGPVGLTYTLNYRTIDKGTETERMGLEVVTNPVEAQARKLKTSYTLEAAADLKSEHGIDLQDEFTKMTAKSVDLEYINEFINDISNGTPNKIKLDLTSIDRETMLKLRCNINVMAHEIARMTRRGSGNVLWTSPRIVSLLEKYGQITPNSAQPELNGLNVEHVGTLNQVGVIDIYSYTGADDNFMIMGYKGRNGETDTGIVLSPYIPLMTTGVVMNPDTLTPMVSFMTKYGKQGTIDSSKAWDKETNNRLIYYGVFDLTLPGEVQLLLEDAA